MIRYLFFMLNLVGCLAQSASSPINTKSCYNISIPATVTNVQNLVWGQPEWKTQLDIVEFDTALNRWDYATTFNPISGVVNKTATYTIKGTYCEPLHQHPKTMILATHGGTLDRYYWDFQYQPTNYSFVNYAINKGYSAFFYDRLGAGESSMESGYSKSMSLDIAILEQLVKFVRAGFPGTNVNADPDNIVLLGHSLGSVISNGLVALHPTIVEGVILTGWGFNRGANAFGVTLAAWQPVLANSISRFAGYDNGWLSVVSIYSYLMTFYKIPFVDVKAAEYALDHSWPGAIMELLSIAAINFSAPNVEAPVLFMVGEYDFLMCGGYCPGMLEPTASSMFPNSVGYKSYIHPNTGHCLNSALNATGSYQVITDFIRKNGL